MVIAISIRRGRRLVWLGIQCQNAGYVGVDVRGWKSRRATAGGRIFSQFAIEPRPRGDGIRIDAGVAEIAAKLRRIGHVVVEDRPGRLLLHVLVAAPEEQLVAI